MEFATGLLECGERQELTLGYTTLEPSERQEPPADVPPLDAEKEILPCVR